jgi:hypothetical protein
METDTNTMNELEKETAPVQEPQADLETTATFTQPVEGPVMESIPQPEPPVGGKVKKGFLRACGSWTDIIPIAAMVSVIMILFGVLVNIFLNRNVIPAGIALGFGMKGFCILLSCIVGGIASSPLIESSRWCYLRI